jgi:hypothetical protein
VLNPFSLKLSNLAQQLKDTTTRIGFEVVEACHETYHFARFYSTKDKPGFKLVFEKWRTHYKNKMRKSADTATKTM